MHVRCPHCHDPIEFVKEASFRDVACPSCSRQFNLVGADEETIGRGRGPRSLAHFELIERIGMGAFGSVYKAQDTHLDRVVAIKIPRKEQLDPQAADAFLRDARAAGQLRHPNIVGVHEVGREGDTIYIVMDYVEGADLAEWLRDKPMPPREAAELLAEIADAVQHAHDHGVVHRDLKPANVMLDRKRRPHIMDFGLAKRESAEITMTVDGATLGTPAYMSPEQASGRAHEADARSDVYSLGVILYEMLAGTRPFHGETRMLIVQILEDEPPPLRRKSGQIARDLETICLKCLHKDPARRYETAKGLAADLRRWLAGDPIEARPVSAAEKLWMWWRKRPSLSIAAGAACLVALVAAVVVAGQAVLHQSRLKAEEGRRIETLIDAMASAHGPAVPYAIRQLQTAPREVVFPRLKARWTACGPAQGRQQVHLSYALARYGDVPADFLVMRIGATPATEAANVITALATDPDKALGRVRAWRPHALRVDEDFGGRFSIRLAIISLYLGDPVPAETLCQVRPDSTQRARFIDEFSDWHGDLEDLSQLVQDVDNPDLQSALCLAVGGVSSERMAAGSPEAVGAWKDLLTLWFESPPERFIHSSAGWALRTWQRTLSDHPIGSQGWSKDWFDIEVPKLQSNGNRPGPVEWRVNRVGMTMLRLTQGRLVRRIPKSTGSPNAGEAEEVVMIGQPFWMSDFEVSADLIQQFRATRKKQPVGTARGEPTIQPASGAEDAELSPPAAVPVRNVAWHEAVLFCNWLSRQCERSPCYVRSPAAEAKHDAAEEPTKWQVDPAADGYRLPTLAEWQYAAQADATTRYICGDPSLLPDYAWYGQLSPEPCGLRKPNPWGLFNMHGNVAEWTQTELTESKYAVAGGNWSSPPSDCHTFHTQFFPASTRSDRIGFRVVQRDE